MFIYQELRPKYRKIILKLFQVATEIKDDIKLAVDSKEIEVRHFDDLTISQAANIIVVNLTD